MNNQTKYILTISILSLSILWIPFQKLLFHVDEAGRSITVLVIFSLLVNLKEICKWCISKPVSFCILLGLYMVGNGLFHHSQDIYAGGVMGIFYMTKMILMPVAVMLLTICVFRYKYDNALNVLTLVFILYSVISIFTGSTEYDDVHNELANTNEVVLMIIPAFSFLIIQYVRKKIDLIRFVGLIILVFASVLLTGSRMGFGMAAIIGLMSILLLRNKNSISSTLRTTLLLVASYFVFNYILSNTGVGERLAGTTTQVEDMNLAATDTFWDIFGDRGLAYYYSWPYFLEHPFFGIGFHQWQNYNMMRQTAHSEYLTQYLEGGLTSFSLYLLFFIGLIVRTWKCRTIGIDKESRTAKVLFASLLAVAFADFVLFTYNSLGVFVIYGAAYSIIVRTKLLTTH